MIQFANIKERVLRNGSSWSFISGVKEDKTMSGKPKRMLYASMAKKPFTVKMRFDYEEYLIFKHWYEEDCYFGLNSFAFPTIDSMSNQKIEKEYQFVAGAAPQFSNPTGKAIECTMQWEEV